MLEFTHLEQQYPKKEDAKKRRHNFEEIYAPFDPKAAAMQASRCSQCGIPFCQVHCPLQNNIPDWLKLTAEGRLEEAYELASATNTFPEICGRICPQDRLCEGNCVIEKGFDAVTIGSVEKYITDTALAEGWVKPITLSREKDQSIGIIGAGPAGLAAADMLRRKGYKITIYDRYDRVGGLLIYGIPNFKLDKKIVQKREALFREGGIQFELEYEIGAQHPLEELREKHDAVLIATGVYKAREATLHNHDIDGIHMAMDYLTASNRKGLGDAVTEFDNGTLNAKDRHVVVVGGGDTAMDCVRTAIRQDAKSVTCLYRRDRANMPGSQREVAHAEEEGVVFKWLSMPKAFLGNTHVEGLQVQRMRLGEPDDGGRQRIEPLAGDEFHLQADMVIQALGFEPEDLPTLFGAPSLLTTRYGTLDIQPQRFETSISGVYAAGDIVRGASLVVWAIRDGREAAMAIDARLTREAAKQRSAA